MTSIECLPPGMQPAYTPPSTVEIECGCCHFVRTEGHVVHPVLGQLCVYCSNVFDYTIDTRPRTRWQRFRPQDSCAACIEEGADRCPVHLGSI